MSKFKKQVEIARRLSKLLKTFSYIIWFVMLGAVTLNMIYMSNWWTWLSAASLPVPSNLIFITGVSMIFTLIALQSLFIYVLYRVKITKEKALNEKSSNLETDRKG